MICACEVSTSSDLFGGLFFNGFATVVDRDDISLLFKNWSNPNREVC